MASLTLVAISDQPQLLVEKSMAPFLETFLGLGHRAELLIPEEPARKPGLGRVTGKANAALRGLRSSAGDVILLIDVNRPYTPADALAVAAPLLKGSAQVAVGCPGEPKLSSRLLAPLARTSDPWSGLVGIRREAFALADSRLRPVGERFALEIVQRVEGARVDVPLPDRDGDHPRGWHFDDVRHLKRLADDRLGTLSRLIQFCFVGASGMVVDLTFYALFLWALKTTPLAERTLPILGSPLDMAVAGLLSVLLALIWNFTLNRRLTFNDSKRGSVVGQFLTYVLSNALGVTISLSLRLSLPRWFAFFDRHRLAAAVVGIVASTGVSFSMARIFVFPNEAKERALAEAAMGDADLESSARDGTKSERPETAATTTN